MSTSTATGTPTTPTVRLTALQRLGLWWDGVVDRFNALPKALRLLLVLLFAVRPFIKNLASPSSGQMALAGPGQPVTRLVTLSDGTQQQVVVDQAGEPIAIAGPAPTSDIDSRIDIAKIEGQVKASSIKRVSEFVEKHPDESVAILRNWLHESN